MRESINQSRLNQSNSDGKMAPTIKWTVTPVDPNSRSTNAGFAACQAAAQTDEFARFGSMEIRYVPRGYICT